MESWLVGSSSTPPEVKRMISLLPKADFDGTVQPLIRMAVDFFLMGSLPEGAWSKENLAEWKVDELQAKDLFTGAFCLLRSVVRARTKPETVEQDLRDLFNDRFRGRVPEELINAFLQAVADCGGKDSECIAGRRLTNMRWRVDVVMTSTALSKVRKPYVLAELHFDDGEVKTLEMSVEKFQDFRYHVARVLKEMNQIERSRWVEEGQDPAQQEKTTVDMEKHIAKKEKKDARNAGSKTKKSIAAQNMRMA